MFSTINEDEFDWKNATIKRIQHRIYGSSDSFTLTNINVDDDKLVVIYGPPQIGKTSLILYLLGIDDTYHYNNSDKSLYTILRGKSSCGASTATAISYRQSNDDTFYLNDKALLTSEDVINEMANIRKEVEENRYTKNIVNLSIPKSAFITDDINSVKNLILIDMPGIGSNVIKEREHVNQLYKTYLSLATAIMVVINTENIQLLTAQSGNTYGLLRDNWYNHSGYILVTTKSFSQDSVFKTYFNKEINEKSFYDYIKQLISENIQHLDGFKGTTLPCFSFDLGSSLLSLKEKLNDDQKFNMLLETNEKMAHELRCEIQKHKGDNLDNIIGNLIDDYKANVDEILKYNNETIKVAKKKNIKYSSKDKLYVENLKTINKNIEEIESENTELKTTKYLQNENNKKDLSPFYLDYKDLSEFRNKCIKQIEAADEGIHFNKTRQEIIKKALIKYQETAINLIREIEGIGNCYEKQQLLKKECRNYSVEDNAKLFKHKNLSSFKSLIEVELADFDSKIYKKIISYNTNYYDLIIKENDEKLKRLKSDLAIFTNNKGKNEIKIKNTKKDIGELEKNNEETRIRQDILLNELNNYITIAEDEFNKCKNKLIDIINESKNKYEKMEYFLFLSKLELDFYKTKGLHDVK